MSNYQYLIFDVDDTLIDFDSAFATAQRNIAEKLGIEPSKEYFETDEKCGWKAWEESGLDQTDEKDVQENYHVYYYNPKGKSKPDNVLIDYEVKSVRDIVQILL